MFLIFIASYFLPVSSSSLPDLTHVNVCRVMLVEFVAFILKFYLKSDLLV